MSPGNFLKYSATVFAALLLVLLLLVLFSPRLFKTDWVQERALAYVSSKFSGQVKWAGFQWSLFPSPRLRFLQVSFEKADQVEARSGSITAYPRILALLRGRIDLGRVVVEAPFIRIAASENTPASKPLKEGLGALSGLRPPYSADFTLELQKGRVVAPIGHEPAVSFEEINGEISFLDSGVQISLACLSDWLGAIAIEGSIDPEKGGSHGKVTLQPFRPHRLLHAFVPQMKATIKDSLAQVTLEVEMTGTGNIALKAEGRMERAAITAHGRDLEIGFPRFSGSARIDDRHVSVVLRQLVVDQEGREVSGTLTLSPGDPRAELQLVGKGLDVEQVREVTLALFGEDKSVRTVFDVLRGGMVPSVTLTTRGNHLRELTLLSNLIIRGELQKGALYVREPELDLREVSGDALIQDGLLEATNAQARLGTAAQGRNGGLTLGLDKGDDRFHLDVEIEADVGQFPVYLPRVLKNRVLVNELSLMADLRGRASGRLVLGEDLKALRTSVSVSGFRAGATYGRVPFPVQVAGGSIELSEEGLDFRHLRCVIGKSEFLDLDGTVGWGPSPFLDIRLGKTEAVMDEVSPWLESQSFLSEYFTHVKDLKGILSLNEMVLKGPLTTPRDWRLEMAGRMKDFSCDIVFLSERIHVDEGGFGFSASALKSRLSLEGARVLFSDGVLLVTGSLDEDLPSSIAADFSVKGELGSGSMRELARLAGLPPQYAPSSPLSVPIARYWRSADGTTRMSGDLFMAGDVSVSLECLVTKKRVAINHLVVRDAQSFAQMNLHWQDRTLDLAFKGDMKPATFSKLPMVYTSGTGGLKGDFRARVSLDLPLDSSFNGSLRVEDVVIPWGTHGPVKVSHCALSGERDLITVESASVSVHEIPFQITGDVRPMAGELFVDLDISTGRLVWPEVGRIFGSDGLWSPGPTSSVPPHLPVRGSVRLEAETLEFGKRNWVPFKAHISITDDGWTMEVKETSLCGISMPGVLQFAANPPVLKVFPASQGQSLFPAIRCLWGERTNVTGKFDLSGRIEGKLSESPFSKGLSGELAFRAKDGRIYRYELLSKIFAFLNLTELLRAKLPDMGEEGFAYNTMEAKTDLLNGKLAIREAVIDGKSMEIGCEGEVDLLDEQLDLRILVAPLKTIDFIVKHIPGLNYVLGGTLVSFPVRVTGHLADPTITPLSPSAVGHGLLGIMERALTLPVKIIEPVLPDTSN